LYPRISTPGRRPASMSFSHNHRTTGVFPVPPAVKFPTLTTARGKRFTPFPRSNRRFRHDTTAA
jgi:hypothetical protein